MGAASLSTVLEKQSEYQVRVVARLSGNASRDWVAAQSSIVAACGQAKAGALFRVTASLPM